MKAVNIIKETVEYYKTNSRGIKNLGNGFQCVYYNEVNGAKCAVGRCFTKKGIKIFGDVISDYYGLFPNIQEHPENYFYSKYKGKSEHFWSELQILHDSADYWVKNELGGQDLTDVGKIKYRALLIEFKND